MKNDKKQDVGLQRESNAGKKPGGVTGKGFMPGKSGNPSGRRKGSVSLLAAMKRELTHESAGDIARKVIRMAKAGNLEAAKLVLSWIGEAAQLAQLVKFVGADGGAMQHEVVHVYLPEKRSIDEVSLPAKNGNGEAQRAP